MGHSIGRASVCHPFSHASWISLWQWQTYQIDEPRSRWKYEWYDSDVNVSLVLHPHICSDEQTRPRSGCRNIPSAAHPSAAPSHMLLRFCCTSGQLAELTYLSLAVERFWCRSGSWWCHSDGNVSLVFPPHCNDEKRELVAVAGTFRRPRIRL
jgi:hypothetical protein